MVEDGGGRPGGRQSHFYVSWGSLGEGRALWVDSVLLRPPPKKNGKASHLIFLFFLVNHDSDVKNKKKKKTARGNRKFAFLASRLPKLLLMTNTHKLRNAEQELKVYSRETPRDAEDAEETFIQTSETKKKKKMMIQDVFFSFSSSLNVDLCKRFFSQMNVMKRDTRLKVDL